MISAGNFFTTFDRAKVIRLLCITWAISKAICYKLWLAERLFPLVPVTDTLSGLPAYFHLLIFILSMSCMAVLIIYPNRRVAVILLLLELFACMLDQNRWQPWEYQFIFMLAGYIFIKDDNRLVFSWQLIIAGIFFFSGISKLNSAFIHDIWQNLFLHRWLGINSPNIWITRAGYILPLIELFAGIALLIYKTKKPAVWILVLMHVIILLLLGPTGLNMNGVVWPWNVCMPLMLLLIFHNNSFEYRYLLSSKPFIWLLLICWWILPWFQLIGYWDKYLSAVLYSGGVEQLFICTDNPDAKKKMEPYLQKEFRIIPCSPVLSVYKWGISEMKTAPYPEPRMYKAIIDQWKINYHDTSARFYLYRSGFVPSVKEIGQ